MLRYVVKQKSRVMEKSLSTSAQIREGRSNFYALDREIRGSVEVNYQYG